MRIIVWIAMVSAIALALAGCNRYSAESIEGWVVDGKTKRPIEGVIVVADWQLHKNASLAGIIPASHLYIRETRTDRNGLFRFEEWGPRTAKWGFFIDRDPALLFFKEGYEFHNLKNPAPAEIDTSKIRRSVWNGETIEMRKFDGGQKEYATHLSSLHTAMHSILYSNRCEWKSTPRLLSAMAGQATIFRENGITSTVPSLDDISGYFCGSAEKHLKSMQAMDSNVVTTHPIVTSQ